MINCIQNQAKGDVGEIFAGILAQCWCRNEGRKYQEKQPQSRNVYTLGAALGLRWGCAGAALGLRWGCAGAALGLR